MATTIITLEDLRSFKEELLKELAVLISKHHRAPQREWLKSHEVRRLLTVSPNTLHAMRERGLLPYTKIGGVIYYKYDDVLKMLEQNNTKQG